MLSKRVYIFYLIILHSASSSNTVFCLNSTLWINLSRLVFQNRIQIHSEIVKGLEISQEIKTVGKKIITTFLHHHIISLTGIEYSTSDKVYLTYDDITATFYTPIIVCFFPPLFCPMALKYIILKHFHYIKTN